MIKVAVWAIGLAVFLCAAAAAQEELDKGDEPPPRNPAVWTSPFVNGTLTEGEYLILDRVRTTRLPSRRGHPQEELILARYQAGRDQDAFALGLVSRSGDGYECRELLRDVAGHPRMHLLRRGSHAPVLMLESNDGSGGFLTLDTFQQRGGRWVYVDHREGLYQGELRNPRESYRGISFEVITRVPGPVNAFPKREYRERWTLTESGLVRTSRVMLRRLPNVAGRPYAPGITLLPHDE